MISLLLVIKIIRSYPKFYPTLINISPKVLNLSFDITQSVIPRLDGPSWACNKWPQIPRILISQNM